MDGEATTSVSSSFADSFSTAMDISLFSSSEWALILAIAFLIDLAIGALGFIKNIPVPDQILRGMIQSFARKLNREKRSPITLIVRGLLLAIVFCVVTGVFGYMSESVLKGFRGGEIILIILTALIIRQRRIWASLIDISKAMTATNKPNKKSHALARNACEKALVRLNSGLIANGIMALLFGLSGLLAYRMLTIFVANGSPKGTYRTQSAFYVIPTYIHDIISFIPTYITASLMMATSVLVPNVRKPRLAILFKHPDNNLYSKSPILHVAAYAFNIQFESGDPAGKWIGPKEGTSRFTAGHTRQILLSCLLVSGINLLFLIYMASGSLVA